MTVSGVPSPAAQRRTLAVPTASYVAAGMVGKGPSAEPTRLPSLDRLCSVLGKRFELVVGRSSTVEQVVLDTADRRLRAVGLELVLETAANGQRWVLSGPSGTAEVVPANNSLVIRHAGGGLEEHVPTTLSDRVAPVIGIRALLPIVELQRQATPIALRNHDHKKVVRLAACDLAASRPGEDAAGLDGRLEVQGVLGYHKEVAKVHDAVSSTLGLQVAPRSVADEAALALGLDPEGVPRRPKTTLTPAQPAGEAAIAVLTAQATVVEANLPGALADLDTEFLHDLRVAVRRSRSVLRQLKRVFPADARSTQARALRWLQTVTGPTRDLDVQLLEWSDLVSDLSAQRRLDTEPARALLSARRAKEFRAMRRTLRSAAFERRWSAWRSFLANDEGNEAATRHLGSDYEPAISDLAGRRIRRVYRRMVREGAAIDDSSPATALHDLRKRGKELRYLLELFGDLWRAAVVKLLIADLKRLQDVLGRHQDREVQAYTLRALVPDLAGAPGGAEAVLALGSVVDRLESEQRRARADFAASFAAFASPKQAKQVDATFGRSG